MFDLLISYLLPTAVFLLFCLTHSALASHKIKVFLFDKTPALKPYYRLLYNLIAVLFLGFWLISLPPDQTIYKTEGILFLLLIVVQLTFAWLSLKSVLAQNGMTFLGVRQLMDKIKHDQKPGYLDEPARGELVTTGLYGKMRHPLYTFVMLLLICSPIMTYNLVYTILMFGLYFLIGSIFEERNLIRRFGDDYKKYRKEVPRFIPKIIS